MTQQQIDNIFRYHSPRGDQPRRYQDIREAARIFATLIFSHTPSSAEQTTAIRKLQECVMFANAAIAINDSSGNPKGTLA